MIAQDTWGWKFTANDKEARPIDSSDVRCNECKEFSPLAEWRESSIDCETCGDHDTMVCPKCEEHADHVEDEPMEIREPLDDK